MAKVSMDRIYRWIQSGKVPALKIAKRVTRIPRRDFEMFLEEYMKQDKE
jgi:excisionase family DNA binding protein